MARSRPLATRVLPLLIAAAVFASACSSSGTSSDPSTSTSAAPSSSTIDPPTSGPTTTAGDGPSIDVPTSDRSSTTTAEDGDLVWNDCGQLECTTVQVPINYDDPSIGTLDIAVARHQTDGDRIGVLFVNPGGPGASGIDFVAPFVTGFFPDDLADRFDIVSFDPRGVGASEPSFACGDDGEQLALTNSIEGDVDTPAELELAEDAVGLCVESMGAATGRLHTDHVARDMDTIRAAIGEEQISYFGFSYGSTIGAWYATLFPDRVRAMVLDGARNPIDDISSREVRVENELDELRQFSVLLNDALDACDSPACPIYNDGDPRGYFVEATKKLHLVADELSGNPVAGALGVITTLYSETTWPQLYDGLAELQENDDPTLLALFADFQFGGESGQASVTAHVNCLDEWVAEPGISRAERIADNAELDDRLEDEFPLLWELGVDGFDPCPYYDTFAPPALTGPLDGGGVPIVVIGNRSDPATPFVESEQLATTTLANGHLVETTHFQHTVYPLNDCVNEIVHAALIDDRVPDEQRVICPQQ